MKTYTTSQIAKLVSVHPNTVRLYEQWGYISKVDRDSNGYRILNDKHLDEMRLARIAFPGPYPVSSKPLFDMMKSYRDEDYSAALNEAKKYMMSVSREKENTLNALEILKKWYEGDYGTSEIIANSRKEFAKLLNLSTETVRTWERNGIYEPDHKKSRYKTYSRLDYEKVTLIRLLRKSGFSIASLAEAFNSDKAPSEYLKDIYKNTETAYEADEWLNHLERHISRASRLIKYIEARKN